MTGRSADFPTFCHISDYWPDGYQQLDLMLACSYPLRLWSPSAVGIRRHSSIGVDDYLGYVHNRFIRICGRRRWLTDPSSRDSSSWEGAPWDPEIDGPIRDICLAEDRAGVPMAERTVMIADDEDGWAWADDYLARKPAEVDRWNRIYRRRDAARVLPSGVVDTVERMIREPPPADRDRPEPYRIAKGIMRDARNHTSALVFSGAEAPFFVNRSDAAFYKLLMKARDAPAAKPSRAPPPDPAGDIVEQMLELMATLDRLAGPESLKPFIVGKGHRELTGWLARMCHELRRTGATGADGEVAARLREALERGAFKTPLQRLLATPTSTSISIAAFVASTADIVLHGAAATGGVAFGLSALTGGYGALQQLGLATSRYAGPSWPFLRAYGKRPTPELVRHLRHALQR